VFGVSEFIRRRLKSIPWPWNKAHERGVFVLRREKAKRQMIPFIGPEFSDYLFEGRWDIEKPLGMPPLANGHPHDDDKPKSLLVDGDEISDQHIWTAIRYLDPARDSQNNGRPVSVTVIAVLLTWIVVLAVLLNIAI